MSDGLGIGKQKLVAEIVKQNWGLKSEKDKNVFTYQDLLYVIQEMNDQEGKKYMEGGRYSINYGFEAFRKFAEMLVYRNLANYDTMILLTGPKGAGKSSSAMMIGREICKILGTRFDPTKNMVYTNSQLMNAIDQANKFDVIIADESINFCSSENWAKAENKELKKKLAQVRTKHLFFILCFPLKPKKVDKVYLESFVNYFIDIFSRGQGAVYVRDSNPNTDSWRLEAFKDIGHYNEFTNKDKILAMLKKHPNFWIPIKIPKPPRWLYDKYLKVREKNVYDEDAVLSNVSKEDIWRAALILSLRDIMSHDTTLTMNRILLHIKNEMDLNLTKSQLQYCLEDAKQLMVKVREKVINAGE